MSLEGMPMTYLQAALTILAYTDRPLTIGELTAVAVGQGLVRPRGRTPDRSMSSILYRRMATDADAPITAVGGRFWLRGRPLPVEPGLALRPAIRHTRGSGVHHQRGTEPRARRTHTETILPPPPLHLPLEALGLPEAAGGSAPAPGLGARERAILRLDRRLAGLRTRLAARLAGSPEWDAARTETRLVAPLLTLLGYRNVDRLPLPPLRGRISRVLLTGRDPVLLLHVLRAGHVPTDADARSTLTQAAAAGIPWAVLTNGHEWRLYAVALPTAIADPGGARVLRVEPLAWTAASERMDTARLLWLLSRKAVRDGALDAYLVARVVGAALLAALDRPGSALVGALDEAVHAETGLRVPSAVLARQARLAIREARGRDGEPHPVDIPAVAAIPSTLLTEPRVERMAAAS